MSPTHHLQQGTLGLSRCYTPLKKQRISRSGPLSQQRQQQVLTADIGMPCLLRRPQGYLARLSDLYEADADRIMTDDTGLYQELTEYLRTVAVAVIHAAADAVAAVTAAAAATNLF